MPRARSVAKLLPCPLARTARKHASTLPLSRLAMEPASSRHTVPTQEPDEPLTSRRAAAAIAFGLLAILLINIGIRTIELVSGQYISNGVPPLPAFAAVLILSLVRPILQRRAPRLAPTRGQILLIYSMLTIAVILSGLYHVRGLLPRLVALQYWGTKNPSLAPYGRYLPSWLAPHDMRAIKDYYEGSAPGGRIAWSAWIGPLGWWSLLLVVMFLGVFSMVTLVQRQWIRHEKLSFPLLTIPLMLTAGDWSAFGSVASRRAFFLIGFAIAGFFNGINILHILYPFIPAPGFEVSLEAYFQNRPWTPLQPVRLYFMLETMGIGYFVPLEVTFSAWLFYVLNRIMAIVGTAAGYDQPGFPFNQDQCGGGYIAIGLLLLWGLRRSAGESLRKSFSHAHRDPRYAVDRWSWIGVAFSVVFVLGFCQAAGFSLWLAIPYFVIVGLVVLVYARIRAETGVPFTYIFPEGETRELFVNTISVPRALAWGGTRSFVLLSAFAWFSRFPHPDEQAAYQLDSLKLSEQGRIPYRSLFIALLLAFLVGLAAAYWAHLSAYYAQGSNLIASAGTIGEYRDTQAREEYELMATQLSSPPFRSMPRLVATAGGFGFAALLMLLRQRMPGFPFHPLGFLMATAYQDSDNTWFPMLVAWLCKFIALRAGGLPLYRRGMPLFLGLAVGHFLFGGIFFPVLSLFLPHTVANAYHLIFGV